MQATPVRPAQAQRGAHERPPLVDADDLHQAQGLRIGADEDVLPVVERQPADVDAARSAAKLRRHLVQRDGMAAQRRFHRGRQAGPAATDDGDPQPGHHRPRQFVHIAIHSLRSGVSDVRWCSTWKLSASISRSSVR